MSPKQIYFPVSQAAPVRISHSEKPEGQVESVAQRFHSARFQERDRSAFQRAWADHQINKRHAGAQGQAEEAAFLTI